MSVILKNKDDEFELLFLGDLENPSHRTLAECVNESYRSTLMRFYKPEVNEMELPNNAYFYMANHYFDSIRNCLICINPDSGVMDIVKVVEIKLPKDKEIHSIIHHESKAGGVELVNGKELKEIVTEKNSSYFLKELLKYL